MMRASTILRALVAAASLCAMDVFGSIVVWGNDSIYKRETTRVSEPKKLIDDVFTNIVSVSSAPSQLGIVAFKKGRSNDDELGFFLVDLRSGQWQKVFERRSLQDAALSPDGSVVAFLACDANSCELRLRHLVSTREEEVIATSLSRRGGLAWSPNKQQIAVANDSGWIELVELTTKTRRPLVKGENPTWSGDGKKLAYVSEKAIWIYDFDTQKPSRAYQRQFWQSRMVGSIYWGPSNVIAFNVAAGIDGYQIECLVLNTESREVISLQQGYSWCGPWLH